MGVRQIFPPTWGLQGVRVSSNPVLSDSLIGEHLDPKVAGQVLKGKHGPLSSPREGLPLQTSCSRTTFWDFLLRFWPFISYHLAALLRGEISP